MFGQPKNNPSNLRVIKTARTLDAINLAANNGFRPLVKAVVPSPKIHSAVVVYQHRKTGEIVVEADSRCSPGIDYEIVIPFRHFYPYSFSEPYAAYLVPPDLAESETVWLEDLIEDLVAVYGNQGWHPRLESSEAIWKKGDFVISFNPEKDARRLIG
jgi:hypothetical protein